MKIKMPWLKNRLRAVGRTPAGLARHLKLSGPRVYEMIGGRRGMQPKEIEPTAQFLNWSVEELLRHLPEKDRVVPVATAQGLIEQQPEDNPALLTTASRVTVHDDLQMIPILGTARDADCTKCDCKLTGTTTRFVETLPAFRGRSDIRSLYMASNAMKPWRGPGELVLFEQERPPSEYDYVVIFLQGDNELTPSVMVRQLIETKAGKLHLRQHNPAHGQKADIEIDLKTVTQMYRILTWDDCVR